MGSNAVISVLGFLVVFSLLTTQLNKRNTYSYDNTYGYVKYTTARDIARNSIQVVLRKIDTLTVVTSSSLSVSGSMDRGSYNVSGVVLNDTTIRLMAIGTFNDTVYTIKTTLVRDTFSFPDRIFKAALGLRPVPVNLNMNGTKDTIDGRNHDILGNLLPTSPDSVPAIHLMTSSDSANIYNLNLSHMSEVLGTPKIKADTTVPDPNTFADTYKSIADYLYTQNGNGNTIINSNLGDSTHPVIVYCDGTKNNGSQTGQFKYNAEGWGILVVKGMLDITSAGATWHGLVIVYGKDQVTFNIGGGNCQVYGVSF